MTDKLIREAEAKRDAALAEARRWDDFIRSYNELVGSGVPSTSVAYVRCSSYQSLPRQVTGRVAETEQATVAALKEAGRPLLTRELLDILTENGIEVGGKDPVATLSARLSRSELVENVRPHGWHLTEKATSDTPTTGSLAALFGNPEQDREAGPGGGT